MALAPSTRDFAETLLDLLREEDEYTTAMGTPNVAAFARALDGVSYESLRRVLAGSRAPEPSLVEEVARVLRVPPTHFLEYRLWLAQREFDVREVGYERALENLRRWAERRVEQSERRRGG